VIVISVIMSGVVVLSGGKLLRSGGLCLGVEILDLGLTEDTRSVRM
jgi:hypothetical protein